MYFVLPKICQLTRRIYLYQIISKMMSVIYMDKLDMDIYYHGVFKMPRSYWWWGHVPCPVPGCRHRHGNRAPKYIPTITFPIWCLADHQKCLKLWKSLHFFFRLVHRFPKYFSLKFQPPFPKIRGLSPFNFLKIWFFSSIPYFASTYTVPFFNNQNN